MLLKVRGVRVTFRDPSGDGSLVMPCSPGEPMVRHVPSCSSGPSQRKC